jgi:hypothetical protein
VIVKKMGSTQKAVEEFLAVCDDTMVDCWMPGEPIFLMIWTQ